MESALYSTTSTVANGTANIDDAKLENADFPHGVLQEKGKLVLAELDPEDDPKNLSLLRKWLAVIAISSAALCTSCASSLGAGSPVAMSSEFHVSNEVAILGVSLFCEGFGIGPLLSGPLSEFYGRNPIYWVSWSAFFVTSFPVAFAPNIVVFLIFRFLGGFVSAAFLSVAGGSVSDLFSDETVATPMAFFTLCPFAGPVLGPLISGFVNQHVSWRWAYYIEIIWAFVELVGLIVVPETYAPVILKNKATRMRKNQNIQVYAPMELEDRGMLHEIMLSCYKPFELLLFDRMALLLSIWSALVLGILYLAFQAFPIVFGEKHGFNLQMVGCSFLGIGLGLVLGTLSQPIWNRIYKRETIKYNGHPPPEMRLLIGMLGGILVPVGLFWIAFTTFDGVHWIVPMLGSIPFGMGINFVFTATFTYLVIAYRPVAASAMAANSCMRSSFAAGFPLFAVQMYHRLGTVGATALCAGLTAIMAPLPFIFYKYGAQIRANSKYAAA